MAVDYMHWSDVIHVLAGDVSVIVRHDVRLSEAQYEAQCEAQVRSRNDACSMTVAVCSGVDGLVARQANDRR